MELIQYWRTIRKSWWLILLLVIVGMGSTAYFTASQPISYESSMTILLNPAVPSEMVPYVPADYGVNLADSYTELMHSISFGKSVSEILARDQRFLISPSGVAGSISAQLRPNTLFYRISARADSAEHAQQLVTTVVKVFLDTSANQKKEQSNPSGSTVKDQMRQRLEDKLNFLSDQIQSYQARVNTLERDPPSLTRDDTLLQLRGQLVNLQETEIQAILAVSQLAETNGSTSTAIVVDYAGPGVPTPSRMVNNLLVALAASVLFGIGLAFLIDYLDYTVRSPEYLEQVLGMTPMAAIGIVGAGSSSAYGYGYGRRSRQRGAKGETASGPPVRRNGKDAARDETLVTKLYPKSPEAEGFRVLRTNIQFSSVNEPIQSMVVTSTAPGEGKSFTAANLAIVIAQAGKRVILVDTDLRKPSVHRAFNLPNTAGFTNLVLHDRGAEGAIQQAPDVPNLKVITSGPLPPNPSELLNTTAAAEIMTNLGQYADLVIYDAPPAAVVTDPVILATRVDAVIMVINAGTTRRDGIARVRKTLLNVGVKTLIPVLNRVKAHDMQGYYYYSNYYYTTQNTDSGSDDTPPEATNGHKPRRNGKNGTTSIFADTLASSALPGDAPSD